MRLRGDGEYSSGGANSGGGSVGATPFDTGGSIVVTSGGTAPGPSVGGTVSTGGIPDADNAQGIGGGTGGTGGTGALGVADPDDLVVANGDFVRVGPWEGYAWTGSEEPSLGSTIAPDSFRYRSEGDEFCVYGTVAADFEYGGVAELGLCVNGGGNTDADNCGGVWDPAGYSGIACELINHLDTRLTLRIVGALGFPDEAWCYSIREPSGQIPWSDFTEPCWDVLGESYESYDGIVPIDSVRLAVTGNSSSDIDFDFCLRYLSPF